jgi:hypothetical protein
LSKKDWFLAEKEPRIGVHFESVGGPVKQQRKTGIVKIRDVFLVPPRRPTEIWSNCQSNGLPLSIGYPIGSHAAAYFKAISRSHSEPPWRLELQTYGLRNRSFAL